MNTRTIIFALIPVVAITAAGIWGYTQFKEYSQKKQEEFAAAAEQQALQKARELVEQTEVDQVILSLNRQPSAPLQDEAKAKTVAPPPDSPMDDVLGDSEMSYDERRKGIHDKMQHNLSEDDKQSLESFVRSTSRPDSISQPQMDSLKSDALYALRRQTTNAPETTQLLKDILSDDEQGSVMQEFALQHLRRWHDDAPESEKEAIKDVLWDVAKNSKKDDQVATALIGLDDLRSEEELEPRETNELAELALNRLQEESPSGKVAALQSLAEMKDTSAVAPALELLNGDTRHSSTAVRLAAIYLLGQVQDDRCLNQLAQTLETGDDYEKAAAKEALDNLSL